MGGHRVQGEPGAGARGRQGESGGARRSQEEPGGTGGPGRRQEEPGGVQWDRGELCLGEGGKRYFGSFLLLLGFLGAMVGFKWWVKVVAFDCPILS